MRRRRTSVAVAALIATAAAGTPAAGAATTPLSDETTLTRWANPGAVAPIRARPAGSARVVARTRLLTEDGLPEVYLLRSRRTDAQGREWVRVRIPMRPNGRQGWVLRDVLGPFHVVRTHLTVDRRAQTATLRRRGRVVLRVRVGVGTPATPTPAGRFWVREKLRFADQPVYGTRALGTSAYAKVSDWPGGGVVGIHGTSRPGLIPGRPSHGCVRVRNPDMARLYRATPVGTPVHIR